MPYTVNIDTGNLDRYSQAGGGGGGIDTLTADSGVNATNSTVDIIGGTNIATASTSSTVTINFSGILPVASGGTGVGTHTANALLVGAGSSAITSVGPLTNGQLLIGSTGNPPSAATITGTANEITVTNGAGSVTLALANEINVGDHSSLEIPNSASPSLDAAGEIAVDSSVADLTGLFLYHDGLEVLGAVAMPIAQFSTLTDGYVPAYNAVNNEFELVANASGGIDVLTGDGAGSATGSTVDIAGGEGIDVAASGSTVTVSGEDASDSNKGIASFPTDDFSTSSGAVSLVDTVVKSISADSGSATPSSHAFTIAGAGAVSTSGSGGTITITTAGIIQWAEETTTSRALLVNEGVVGNNAATITMTLPTTAAVGDQIKIVQKGAGAIKIAQNAGETIHFGSSDTTTGVGGYIQSTSQWDAVELVCVTANNDWAVLNSVGSWTIV